jgi:hypothetical protein
VVVCVIERSLQLRRVPVFARIISEHPSVFSLAPFNPRDPVPALFRSIPPRVF